MKPLLIFLATFLLVMVVLAAIVVSVLAIVSDSWFPVTFFLTFVKDVFLQWYGFLAVAGTIITLFFFLQKDKKQA